MARISLRTGLDRDVYQIVKKLEDERQSEYFKKGEGKKKPAKLTVTSIYESIKRSNSSLSRQKRRPLEDAIERVLDFRKEEMEQDDDSDDLIEAQELAEKAYKVSAHSFPPYVMGDSLIDTTGRGPLFAEPADDETLECDPGESCAGDYGTGLRGQEHEEAAPVSGA